MDELLRVESRPDLFFVEWPCVRIDVTAQKLTALNRSINLPSFFAVIVVMVRHNNNNSAQATSRPWDVRTFSPLFAPSVVEVLTLRDLRKQLELYLREVERDLCRGEHLGMEATVDPIFDSRE
jgi:hypothetical protein